MSNLYFQGNTYTFGATAPKNIGTGTVNYTFTGLNPNTNYKFIIVAKNALGFSGIAGPINVIRIPRPPKNLQVISFDEAGVTLSWMDDSVNEEGFKLFYYRATEGSYEPSLPHYRNKEMIFLHLRGHILLHL
jgi:hypothetical protein